MTRTHLAAVRLAVAEGAVQPATTRSRDSPTVFPLSLISGIYDDITLVGKFLLGGP